MSSEIDHQYILFSLGDEEYAIPISLVDEIIKINNLIRIPKAKSYFAGIMDIRGKVVKMVDLAIRLTVPREGELTYDRAIVVKVGGQSVGIIVDKVSNVVLFPPESINPPPPSVKGISGRYITGIGKKDDRFIIIIDVEKILGAEELAELGNNAG
ncbi:purine-binding chemotaxis protein CheW [Leptospira gomenensis]|uniref:Purine-binding chemotaxis protein CheW n=1 Tax=Leptospira gomenensis TaxID=2484974 RepID=A0A5F1Z0M7_9LEPT|nr:chemotaxis protein CheW [Leptospira gomenensis]TGK30962.1 purine-binding chemotaxis protein CheW [Leptospira gomenensis]TGK41750.1 purine-binding chemotaxis protein CheW [Leptospira gomenensis]TGK45318.1 purine-binding chemotaxis protein CheW [Leptospira gomenensis]TGK66231.1 purine-binding chemotaxis protein CheW [Leptospira gomenensis]